MYGRCDSPPTVLRHARGARIGHAVLAFSMLTLVLTGLGLGGSLPGSVLDLLGGHRVVAGLHGHFGFVFGTAIGAAVLLGPPSVRHLVGDMVRFRRDELAWLPGFVRYCLRPGRNIPLHHGGRFDPAQRAAFAVVLASTALLVVTGSVLHVFPTAPRPLLGWAVRLHVAGAIGLYVALAVHIVVGSGLLRSHRGVARVMFGDGRVPVRLARALWPGWTEQQLATYVQPGHQVPGPDGSLPTPSPGPDPEA